MSFHINNNLDERPKAKLWLLKPDFTTIERLNGIEGLNGTFNHMNQNEITFNINAFVYDETQQKQVKNDAIHLVKNKYLIKFVYNGQTEWFVIDDKGEVSEEKDYVPVTARYIGSELDKKYVGNVEEIGVKPRPFLEKYLQSAAPNWGLRYVDPKIENVKREYNMSDASISTLIESVTELTDSVVIFHNREREFSLVHRDNAGTFKGLKVTEATYLKSYSDRLDSKDLVTRLYLFGKDNLQINGINPAGTSYIEDFSFYMKPFKRDSNRNVIEHSDYMSDELCHALLDYQEYFEGKQEEYEEISESYSNLLAEQLEEQFKLDEIKGILQRMEDRAELLKPQGAYQEFTINATRNLNFNYATRYMILIKNNGSLTKVTFNGEEYMIEPNSNQYIKFQAPDAVTPDQDRFSKEFKVLSSNANLAVALSTSSEEDFAEEDIIELDKKYNIFKYTELKEYQQGIVTAIEKKLADFTTERQAITHALSPAVFFTPELMEERENFVTTGVWREENHTDPKELLEDGLKQLKEKNNTVRTVEAQLIDFIQSLAPEDKENWDKLSAGDIIRFSNDIYNARMQAFISELRIDFDAHDITLQISDVIDFRDRNSTMANKLANFASTASQVNMQKSLIADQNTRTNEIIQLIEGEWDANERRITAANETVSIDNRGVVIVSPTHPNEMLVAVAGVIAISDDGGQTFKQAINTRGVVAERIMGKLLIGTQLVMENDSGTFRFDNDGLRINADSFHLVADDGQNYFDKLLNQINDEIISAEERLHAEITLQREALEGEMSDMDESLSNYTNELVNALADGMLTQQEITKLELNMTLLEVEYQQAKRRIEPLLQNEHIVSSTWEHLYVTYVAFEKDYTRMVKLMSELDEPQEVPEEIIEEIKTLIKNFKPALQDLTASIEQALSHIQEEQVRTLEYNTMFYATRLSDDLKNEVKDLQDALSNFDGVFGESLSDGLLTMIEKSRMEEAMLRLVSEKNDVDNRYSITFNHPNLVGNTTILASLSGTKQQYNDAFTVLVDKIEYILTLEQVDITQIDEYEVAYNNFGDAIVNYVSAYEEAVEAIQKKYANDAEGQAKAYADGLKSEIDADIEDIEGNLADFVEEVNTTFKDGIITQQERNRLKIHLSMLDKEKGDLIERYNTIVSSPDLQGYYDLQSLVASRDAYGAVHADLVLAIETAIMDDKITPTEGDTATALLGDYADALIVFSKELELAIAALGEVKAVRFTEAELEHYVTTLFLEEELDAIKAQVDGHIKTYYYDYAPTMNNLPASEWTTDELKEVHTGDLFYDNTTGVAYRFTKTGGVYQWAQVKDTEVAKALQDAEDALDLADNKRRVFVVQPIPPYDIGDLWLRDDGELMRARYEQTENGSYVAGDWIKATKYTDDTRANQAVNMLETFQATTNQEIEDIKGTHDAFVDIVNGTFKDGLISDYELKILQNHMKAMEREKADVDAAHNRLLNHPNLPTAKETELQTAYNAFKSTHENLVGSINQFIIDGQITDSEFEQTNTMLDAYPANLQEYKDLVNEIYVYLIQQAKDVADGAKDTADRLDDWKSTIFEFDVEGIASRVGSASWQDIWKPTIDTDIQTAIDNVQVGARNLIKNSKAWVDDDVYTVVDGVPYRVNTTPREHAYNEFMLSQNEYYTISVWMLNLETEPQTYDIIIEGKSIATGEWQTKVDTHTLPMYTSKNHKFTFYNDFPGGSSEYRVYTSLSPDSTSVYSSYPKLEIGNKATDYSEAPEDAEARIDAISIELGELSESLGGIEGELEGAFKDGIIQESEAKSINLHKAQLNKEKADVDQKYNSIYGNPSLSGTAKTNLASAKSALDTSHGNLISYIDTAISNDKVTDAEATEVFSRIGDYEAKLATLSFRFEEANDYISSAKATIAETNAKNHAETKAQEAKEAAEDYAKTKAEAEREIAKAHADGKVTAEEQARIDDVNAKLQTAKEHADTKAQEAENAAKLYADDEIDKIEFGGRNLVKNSSFASGDFTGWRASNYSRATIIESDEDFQSDYAVLMDGAGSSIELSPIEGYKVGSYMVTIWHKHLEGHVLYLFGGTGYGSSSSYIFEEGDGETLQKLTFKMTIHNDGDKMPRIRYASSSPADHTIGKTIIYAVQIERGNKATDWSPAPEDIDAQFDAINTNALGLNEDLTESFKDGIISESESKAIEDSLNIVKSDYENINHRYQNVYNHAKLTGTPKSALYSAKVSFNSAYNSLIDYISSIITSGTVTNTQKSTYTTRFGTYRDRIGDLSDAIESAWDAITTKKSVDVADDAVQGFYDTTIKNNYITTDQSDTRFARKAFETDVEAIFDSVATYRTQYEVSTANHEVLREADGQLFKQPFSYEVTARTVSTGTDTLVVGVFLSMDNGTRWELEVLDEKGSTSNHPELFLDSNGQPAIRLHNHSSTYPVEVIYNKYAGDITNFSRTQSVVEQAANEFGVKIQNMKIGGRNLLPYARLPENMDKWSTWSSKTALQASGVTDRYVWVNNSSGVANDNIAARSGTISIEVIEGEEYTLSFKASDLRNIHEDMRYCYLMNNISGLPNHFIDPSLITREEIGIDPDLGTPIYQYQATFESPITAHAQVLVGSRQIADGNARFYLREVQLEIGNKMTDWGLAPEEQVTNNRIIAELNLNEQGAKIKADKIDLVGDVNIVNGQVRVRHLTATSGNNDLSLTASAMVMSNDSGQLNIGTSGIIYRDQSNNIRYQMDTTLVTSSAFGTSNANVYLAAQSGQEARVVDYRDIPGDGLIGSYRYLDLRAKGFFGDFLNANPAAVYNHLYIRPLGGMEVRITRSETTSSYENLRADGLYGNHLTNNSAEGQSPHVYIRPLSNGEIRVTRAGSTSTYENIRAGQLMINSIFTNTNTNLYLRSDAEIRFSSHGSLTNYRNVRGLFAYFDAFDVNTGTHMYARPKSGGEFRVTRTGTTGTYEDIRFKSWYATSSEKYKTDIAEWDYNVLDIIKEELKLYKYKFKSELDSEYARFHHGVIIERETPPEWVHGDGVDQYELSTWTLKGVQELAFQHDDMKEENNELKERVTSLESELEDMKQEMKNIMKLLKGEG